ncbi:hypothetical protein PMIN02_007751 [Paraphaeosphaeria minitans]
MLVACMSCWNARATGMGASPERMREPAGWCMRTTLLREMREPAGWVGCWRALDQFLSQLQREHASQATLAGRARAGGGDALSWSLSRESESGVWTREARKQ